MGFVYSMSRNSDIWNMCFGRIRDRCRKKVASERRVASTLVNARDLQFECVSLA